MKNRIARLCAAASSGDAAAVKTVLAVAGIDANHANGSGDTALIFASQGGRLEVVRALLAVGGIDANHADDSGDSALICASQDGHAEVVRALLAVDGIDTNHASNEGTTALICASQNGHAEIVRTLLAVDGIDVNHTTNGEGSSALMMAITWCHTSCARALVAAEGIDINIASPMSMPSFGGNTALHDACCHMSGDGLAAMVELLLIAGGCRFQINSDGHTPLDLMWGSADKGAAKAFASGVDYWQRRRHGGHGRGMKAAVRTVLLVRQRLQALAESGHGTVGDFGGAVRPNLPEEIWLAVCACLRSADFMPPTG